MKIREIIENNLNQRERFYDSTFLYQDLTQSNLEVNEDSALRLSVLNIESWLCTDTIVGSDVVLLDLEPVALLAKYARKAKTEIRWFSVRAAKITKDYLDTLVETNYKEINIIPESDLEKDLGPGYSVKYGNQLLTKELFTFDNDEPVTVIKTFLYENDDYSKWENVLVEFKNGVQQEMKLSELYIPYGK